MFPVCIGASGAIDKHFFRRKQETNAVSHLTRYRFYITTVQKDSKNWLKNTRLEYIKKFSSPQRRVSMTTFAKQQFHQNSYKRLSPEKSEVIMIAMHKNQHSLHIKNPKKQLKTSKTFKKIICKGVDGVRKSKSYHKGDNRFGIEIYEMRNQTRLQIRAKNYTLRKISFMTVCELLKIEGKQTVKSHL